MYRLLVMLALLVSFSLQAGDGHKHTKLNTSKKAVGSYVEAMIVVGNNGCGVLLRLNDGQLIKPTNMPRKFLGYDDKVLIQFSEWKNVENSPCDIRKEVLLTDIKKFKDTSPNAKGKF